MRRKVKEKRKQKLGENKRKKRRGSKAKRWQRTERDAKRVNKRKKRRWCWQRDRCEKQSPVYLIDEAVGYASYLYRGLLSCKLGETKKSGKKKKEETGLKPRLN